MYLTNTLTLLQFQIIMRAFKEINSPIKTPQLFSFLFLLLTFSSCSDAQQPSEPKLVGGPCEGCEAVFEYKDHPLSNRDTLPQFNNGGQKIKITGTVLQSDGKTPAENVILYIYHTNQKGLYQPSNSPKGLENHHGEIRTWLQTNENGEYTIYTTRPAPYPNRSEPAHIHYTVLEPNGKYYWIDSLLFVDDPLVNKSATSSNPRGGGDVIVQLTNGKKIRTGNRDIVLGKNIPEYEK